MLGRGLALMGMFGDGTDSSGGLACVGVGGTKLGRWVESGAAQLVSPGSRPIIGSSKMR